MASVALRVELGGLIDSTVVQAENAADARARTIDRLDALDQDRRQLSGRCHTVLQEAAQLARASPRRFGTRSMGIRSS
jgi:hypothetical protein